MSPARFRALASVACLLALPLLALSLPGTAEAGPSSVAATAEPTPSVHGDPTPSATCPPLGCVLPTTPPPLPTPSATPSPTPRASRTPTPTPHPDRTRTASPKPRARHSEPTGGTESPVSGSIDVGGVSGVPESPKAVDSTDSSSTSSASDTLTRLVLLVLGGALLLGLSGAAGLYVTRHRSDE